jgi:hypothetical protein
VTTDYVNPAGTVVAAPAVPAPPPGPGVQPPFVVAPTDGARQRRWLAVGLAGGTALLCCVGSLFGLGGLVVFGNRMIADQARAAVTDYLGALRDERYSDAYTQLCDRERESIDEIEFEASASSGPTLLAFTVGQAALSDVMIVTASLHYEDYSSRDVHYLMEQDTSTGEFEVCGETD